MVNKISVSIPTFNGADFLPAALESILTQTERNFELIISDDCSSDKTLQVVRSIQDERLQVFENQEWLGLVENWNRCIALSSGEYIYIFHQDDVMHPANLEQKLAVLEENPDVGFVFSNIVSIDPNGTVIGGHWNPGLPKANVIYSGKDFLQKMLIHGNIVPCQAVMIRSSTLQKVGEFDPRLRYTPDFEMWLRLCLHANVGYIAQPLVSLRRHPQQESRHYLGRLQEVDEVWRAFQILFSEQREDIPEAERMYRLAITHLQNWVGMFFRQSVRQGHMVLALSFARSLVRFSLIKRRGLPG